MPLYLIFLSCFLFSSSTVFASEKNEQANAQIKQVAGLYKFKSTDPVDPGSQLLLMDDSFFVLGTFFGVFSGTWSVNDDHIKLKMSANKAVYLYGRYTKSLDQATRLRFRGGELRKATVNFNPDIDADRQKLFNADANCFTQPHLHMLEHPINKFELGNKHEDSFSLDQRTQLFNFINKKGYNDFQIFVVPPQSDTQDTGKYRITSKGLEAISEYFDDTQSPEIIPKVKSIGDISSTQLAQARQAADSRRFPQELKSDHRYFPYLTRDEEQDPEETTSFYLIEESSVAYIEDKDLPDKHLFTARCGDED